MRATLKDQTIALAGVVQAATLVIQIAKTGQCSQLAAKTSIDAIFNTDPASTEDAFGGLAGLRLGMGSLKNILSSGSNQEELQALHISMALLKLGQKLGRDAKRQQALGEAITGAKAGWQAAQTALDEATVTVLAKAYEDNISSYQFRIKVPGDPSVLKNPEKVKIVRTLLLAGLRAAILWRQVGGNQWRLIMSRKGILEQATRWV